MSLSENTFVLSLGGSLVVPNGGIDTQYLKKFNTFIRNQISSKKRRFFIVVGGGTTARKYSSAGEAIMGRKATDIDLDWLGVHATRLNAQLIRTIFQDIAHQRVIKHYDIIRKVEEPVVIAAGWKPGWSTDYDAVVLCQDYGIKQVLNLSNIDQVYSKDPKKFFDAKPIVKTTWKEYRKLTGDTWTPSMNVPFDPTAAKLAKELGVTVRILNGKNLEELAKALDGKAFFGTTIQ